MFRTAHCPHCGRSLNLYNRIEKCALTGELVCRRCIIQSRFSDSIAFEIPEEIRQKYRWLDYTQWLVIITLFLIGMSLAWPNFVGWALPNLDNILMSALSSIGLWLGTILLTIILLNMPKLGTVRFYRWLSKPENQSMVYEAIKKQKEEGRYAPRAVWYQRKLALISFMEKTGYKLILILGVILNPIMLVAFYIMRSHGEYSGGALSAILGVLFVLTLIINIANIWIAAAFYSRKDPENNKNRYTIELISWSYVLLQGAVFLNLMFGWLERMGLLKSIEPIHKLGFSPETFFLIYELLYTTICLLGIILPLFVLRLTPNYNWLSNEDNARSAMNPQIKLVITILRVIFMLVFGIAAVGLFIISMELIMVDFAMFFCVTSYYLVLTYFIILFAALKLIKTKKADYLRGKSIYNFIIKVAALVVIINILPTVMVSVYSNPSLERQFNDTYGADWRSRLDPAYAARLRTIRYSAYDAYFGYEIPIKAQYETVYMQDSPRYVKNKTSGEIISNGSSKYTAIVHNMIFDAYLPATPEFADIDFGKGPNIKLPVVMFLHGIGMDRGAGNANWTSQYIANLGFLVVDMSYGFTGWSNIVYTGGKEQGYDFVDQVLQLANFTKFLDQNSDYFHADVSSMFIAGRSFGGWIAMSLGQLANNDFAKGNYSSSVRIKGIIPYYPATDIPSAGSELFEVGGKLGLTDEGAPYIRGSSDENDSDYNPAWKFYNPIWLANNTEPGNHPDVFIIQGMHDYLVPKGAGDRLHSVLIKKGHNSIYGLYPYGSHGFDALHWSHYGQSITYYLARFLVLNK